MLLLASSYYFYMSWKAEYVILIIISTLIDYFAASQIYKRKKIHVRKLFLGLSLFTNLGLLFAFKYFNFVSDSIREFLGLFSIQFNAPILHVLLPVGISFYTFQTLSYTFDVYNKKIKPEKHLGIFAVYVSFFPQLVAGPIERAKDLLPQFLKNHRFEYLRVTNGLKLMLWGFFKKLVIADRLAIIVDTVYNDPTGYTGFPLILATVFFAFQIYCDFSGYCDIAVGAAQIMGIKLMDNFKRPYHATSISDFWRRWHISLYSWFKDYIYIPLGGSRVSIPRWYFNLFIVFFISGVWHGANWTFILWGSLHGFYLIFANITRNFRTLIVKKIGLLKFPKIHHLLKVGITFSLVCFSWIFFRSNSLSDALYTITHMFSGLSLNFSGINIGTNWMGLLIAFGSILFMEIIHLFQTHIGMRHFLSSKPVWLRWATYAIIIFAILLFGIFENKQFIYFQF